MRDLVVLDQATIEQIREAAMQRVAPLRPRAGSFFESGSRTNAGRSLPPYFLVYFLLVELLKFPDLGREEKTAWCIPVEFNGHHLLVQHTKFGVGVFGATDPAGEAAAKEVTTRIHRGCKAARPFFDHLAARAIQSGHINVLNYSVPLFGRYQFLREFLRADAEEFSELDHSRPTWVCELLSRVVGSSAGSTPDGRKKQMRDSNRWGELRQQLVWLHQSVIEAFFSWTEHALVHTAVLNGRIASGLQVHGITQAEWPVKFTTAFDVRDATVKGHYDSLVEVRRDHRNYTSHGAFGKEGEAFQFHSGAGAVSIRMQGDRNSYTMVPAGGALSDAEALAKIDAFIDWLKEGSNEPLWIYLQRGLTTVLTWANDGTYRRALSSVQDMEDLLEYQERLQDDSANMDW